MAQDDRLLAKVVHLRYVDGLTQDRIAERLRVSRFKVLRLLKLAHKRGIVRIELNFANGLATELEREIERQFGIRESVIATPISQIDHTPVMEVATVAAQRMLESLQPSDVLGVAPGGTVRAVISAVPRRRVHGLKIVPLVGDPPVTGLQVVLEQRSAIQQLAERLEAEYVSVPLPRYVASTDLRQAMLKDNHLQAPLEYMRRCTVALVGIGSINPLSDNTRLLPLSDTDRATLQQHEAVGEICGRFFDAHGKAVTIPFDLHQVAMSLEEIRAIPTVIGVAFGSTKIRAIIGALRGGLIDILVTDQATALSILSAVSNPITSDGSSRTTDRV